MYQKSHYVLEVQIYTTADGIPVLGGCAHALLTNQKTDSHFPEEYPKKDVRAYMRPNWYFAGEVDGFVYYAVPSAPYNKYRIVRREPNDIVVVELVETIHRTIALRILARREE